MKKNMSVADRLIRILFAATIVTLYLSNIITGTWAWVLLGVAAIFLLTGLVGVCPLYSLFGIHSDKVRKA